MDKSFTITLGEQELNYILSCLADKPWKETNELIQKVIGQANGSQEQPAEDENPLP